MKQVLEWASLPKLAIIVLVTQALVRGASVALATMFVGAMFAWCYELYEEYRHERKLWHDQKFAELKSKMIILELEVAKMHDLHDAVAKQAEETKKILGNANLVSAFGVRKN